MAKPRLSECCVSYFDECCKLNLLTASGGIPPQMGHHVFLVKHRMKAVLDAHSEYVKLTQNGAKKLPQPKSGRRQRKKPETPQLSCTSDRSDLSTLASISKSIPKTPSNPIPKKFTSPNHFVCIKIIDPEIHKALGHVQSNVVEKCPLIEPALTTLSLLHLTLMVIHLQPDQLSEAIEALDQVKHIVNSSLRDFFAGKPPPSFSMRGLGDFDGQVLFAKVDKGRDLIIQIGKVVRAIFESYGFYNTDHYPVNPHGTLLKLFQAKNLRRQGIRRLNPAWFRDDRSSHFGKQTIDEVHLCSMDKWRDPVTQFYRIEHSIDLGA